MKKTILGLIMILFLVGCAAEKPMNDMPMEEMQVHEVSSEVTFLVDMIPHHQEAVDTAKIIYDSTENEELKELCDRIIVAQVGEIRMMNEWINAWYPENTYESTYMNMMPDLLSLEGVERDNAFLTGMIMHHEMAVMMAEDVLTLNPREEVANFANTIITVQNSEIEEMKGLL